MLCMQNLRRFVFSSVALTLAAVAAAAGPPPAADATDPLADVRRMAEAGIVRTAGIVSSQQQQAGCFGSGAILTPDGYVLTSTTVVPAVADQVKVILDGGKVLDARIVESCQEVEATLLKVEARDLACFPVAREVPAVGQRAYTFGNANGMMQTGSRASFSMGVISGVYEVEDSGGESRYHGPALETTAAVNLGTDGGPLVDQCGQLCGILCLNTSPRRWQGTAVPILRILQQFREYKAGRLKLDLAPPAAAPPRDELELLAVAARDIGDCLVGVTVKRKFPAEVLPRMTWDDYRRQIKDWDQLSAAERAQRQGFHNEFARLLESNQILRRPAGAVTGLIVSAEGHVLTSAFNLGDDIVFKDEATGKPPALTFRGIEAELAGGNSKDLARGKNPIEKLLITLPGGSQREAKLLARHEPLGVALLKIEAKGLKFCDLEKRAGRPEAGRRIGLVGYMGGKLARHTLNPGIVSSPSRNGGTQFQADALLNYGNSGGPLVSPEGRVLGIALAPLAPHTIMGRVLVPEDLAQWTAAPNSGMSRICRMDRLLPVLGDLKAGKTTATKPMAAEQAGGPGSGIAALCRKVQPAFVSLDGGSGVIVSADGWLLTNAHVVGDGKQFDVRTGTGRQCRAKLLGRDPSGDLAVLQLELKPSETVPYLQIGDPEALHVGDRALALSNPLAQAAADQDPTFTLGVISALHQATEAEADALAHDAALNPGGSGGPLVDMTGRVVGINREIVTRWGLPSNTGLGYAISAWQIRHWLPRLARAGGGDVPHGRLVGVEFEDADGPTGKALRVTDLVAGSPAEKAGLKIGDCMMRLDGRPVNGVSHFARAIPLYPAGHELAISVQRADKSLDLKLTLSAAKPGRLGFKLAEPAEGDEHLRIEEISEDSAARQAGLKPGDEILKMGGLELKMPVASQLELFDLWVKQGVNAGDIARMTIRCKGPDGKPVTREVRIVAR